MRIGVGFGACVAAVAVTACTSTANEKVKHGETIKPEPKSEYPITYPVLSDAELARRTNMAERASPGWHVMLDSLGFLTVAYCRESCPGADAGAPAKLPMPPGLSPEYRAAIQHGAMEQQRLSSDDHAKIDQFLAANNELVALDGVAPKKTGDILIYAQATSRVSVATVRVERGRAGIEIHGHLWPRLPTLADLKTDAEMERTLRQKQPNAPPDAYIQHGYRTIAHSLDGPIELRASACLMRKDIDPAPPHYERPTNLLCLDARTIEDITGLGFNTSVHMKDGVVTGRSITR